MTSYTHPMPGQHMYHPNVVPPGIPGPGPMAHLAPGTSGHPASTLHTPVGPTTSLSGTPMEVMQTDTMHQMPEDVAMPQPIAESIEELRAKYKQEILRLEEILGNKFSVDDCSSLIAAGLGAVIVYPNPHLSLEDFEKKLTEFFQTQYNTKAQSGPVLLQEYLNFITKQRGQQRVSYLFGLLITMITKHGILNFSMVCQSVLELFSLQLPLFIQEGLKFVHKLLPTLDYHACRVVITQLLIFLEKCPTLIASPLASADVNFRNDTKECSATNFLSPRDLQLLHSVRDLLRYMLDRKSALLPVYLALDDIELRYPFKTGKYSGARPHWVISELLSSFRDSFSGVARLMTMPICQKLLPAVGISFISSVVWQLDEEMTLCPKVPKDTNRKVHQILPFPAEVTQKRFDLLVHIVSQSICPEPQLPQLYGMPRVPIRQSTTLEQQHLYVQSSMILCVQIIISLLKNCKQGLLEDPERRLWSYQQTTGLCLNYLLRFIGNHRHLLTNSFYHLLYKLLVKEQLRDGRDALMYFFVQSMSFIFRSTDDPTQPVDIMLAIFDYLYPDTNPLLVPETSDPLFVYRFSPCVFWMHLYLKMLDYSEQKKKQSGGMAGPYKFSRPMPRVLKLQIDHLQVLSTQHSPANLSCQELIMMSNALPPHILTTNLIDPGLKQAQDQLRECLNGRAVQRPPSIPLLSCLNLNCKVDTIVKDMVSLVHDPQNSDKRPIELKGRGLIIHTFFSLLHNADLEIAGYKVMTKTPVDVIKKHVYNINTCWLEMVNNRLPVHVTNALKQQLILMITQYLKSSPNEMQNYLYLLLENTALKLIMGLGGQYFLHYLGSKQPSHPIEPEFEELNKVFILTLAQTIHTRGIDPFLWDEYLDSDLKSSPHCWPSHTLRNFPSQLQDFYDRAQAQKPIGPEEMQQLHMQVVEDSQRLLNMNTSDGSLLSYYTQQDSHPTLLCLTWDVIMERSKLSNSFIKAFIALGQRGLMRHMRGFVDYVVFKLCQEKQKINRYIEILDNLIWTYNLFPLEKIILVMAMRNYEGEQLHTCYRLMQLLLLVPANFRFRLKDFLNSENSPSYWSQPEQLNDHLDYHADKPEYFNFEGLRAGTSGEDIPKPLPPFCGNVFTRFLPVIDLVIHRLIEVPPDAAKSLDSLIQQICPLYRYHPKPIMFLYTTLHYYELNLVNRPPLRANLVSSIMGALESIHPPTWYFSREFVAYLASNEEVSDINMGAREGPDVSLHPEYWCQLLDSIKNAVSDPLSCECWTDWRFSEFQTPAAKFLTCTAVEVLTLPNSPTEISKNFINVVLDASLQSVPGSQSEEEVSKLINALGLLMSILPASYHEVLYAEVFHALQNIEEIVTRHGLSAVSNGTSSSPAPAISLSAFSVYVGQNGYIGCVMALIHSFWTHSNVGLLYPIHNWLNTKVKPLVETENHLIFILQLIYPLSVRIFIEKRRLFPSLVQTIYSFVKQVDARNENLFYADTICDVLYHIKYVYLGYANKEEIDRIVSSLQPSLQARLRFLTGGEPHTSI